MKALRVAMAPAQAPDNPYLADLVASLPPAMVEVVNAPWAAVAGRGAATPVDVVHLHWLQSLLQPAGRSAAYGFASYSRKLLRLRRRGVAVAWTMHNAASHETASPRLDRLARRLTAATADVVVVHCDVAAGVARALWPRARVEVIAHPARPPRNADRAATRSRLGISTGARLVVVPGRIRAYRDVAGAVRALRESPDPRLLVAVAGEPEDPALEQEVRDAAGSDPRIRLLLQRLPDADLRDWVRAADVALLPYRRILTSGMAVLCAEEQTPVVAPNLGCLGAQVGAAGALYEGDATAGGRLAATVTDDVLDTWRAAAASAGAGPSWEEAGARHAEVYEWAAARR